MKGRYERNLQELEEAISTVTGRLVQIRGSGNEMKDAGDLFHRYTDCSVVTKELLDDLIKEIRVYDGHRVEIDFKFRDILSHYEKLLLEDENDE